MEKPKLTRIFEIIASNLSDEQIPFAVIGALALGIYGLPRYTADIDLLTEDRFRDNIQTIMNRLGYTCFQKTDAFAQFDSEMGVLGRIDFMFLSTQEGKDLLGRRCYVHDDIWGYVPVVQPTDYIILKLMAIANNPGRTGVDEADIANLLKFFREEMLSENFEPLDQDRIILFADKLEQRKRILKLLKNSNSINPETNGFSL